MTPAVVALQRAGVAFAIREFEDAPGSGELGRAAADALGVDPALVFKTLVVLADERPAVAIVPVAAQLALKAAAKALGAKRAAMCDPGAAERLTGYVVGGISPLGQRRRLPTVLDESAMRLEAVLVSGGRRGLEVELAPADLVSVLAAAVAPIAAPVTPGPAERQRLG